MFFITLYSCQSGFSSIPCTNSVNPEHLSLSIDTAVDQIDVKNFKNPVSTAAQFLRSFRPSEKIKYETFISIIKRNLKTEEGKVISSIKTHEVYDNETIDTVSHIRDPKYIYSNLFFHGKLIKEDYYWTIEMKISNINEEIRRNYLTLIEVLS